MAINQELWTKDFAANLYEDNDWYKVGRDWSEYVNGSIVHIPQASGLITPQEVNNSTSLPISTQAADFDDLTFGIKKLVAPPRYVKIEDIDEALFDTRSEVMKDMVSYMRQAINVEVAQSWQPESNVSGSVVLSSGVDTRENVYGQAAVKKVTFNDVLDARAKLVRQKVNLDDIYMIVDPIMYNDILTMDEFTKADELTIDVATRGFVGMIAGMKIIQRPFGLAYTSTGAIPTINYNDGYDPTHFSSALIFDSSKVGYAVGTVANGEIKIGVEPYATGYYSDIMQGHTRVGGSPLYKTASDANKGVVAIIEQA